MFISEQVNYLIDMEAVVTFAASDCSEDAVYESAIILPLGIALIWKVPVVNLIVDVCRIISFHSFICAWLDLTFKGFKVRFPSFRSHWIQNSSFGMIVQFLTSPPWKFFFIIKYSRYFLFVKGFPIVKLKILKIFAGRYKTTVQVGDSLL